VFALHTVPEAHFFGMKAVWRGATRVQVSDPSRTVVDLLVTPAWGGGIRMVVDVLQAYLKSEHRNLPLLLDYAARLGNGAVFKRMGYLLQQHAPDAADAIVACAGKLTTGYTKLDPALPSDRLVTAWGLWLPAGW
jgi:predicted transcriptional regulator of viral defense system